MAATNNGSETVPAPVAAIAGGLAGVTVMSVLFVVFEVQTRTQMELFQVVARFAGVPGRVYVGFALFVVAGTVAWPLLFVALETYVPLELDPAAAGMGFATVLWLAFVVTGRGSLTGAILLVYAVSTLIAHLAYGFTLGAVYAHLTGIRHTHSSTPT
ncbi:DUF6789 family protein [Haloarchaeobius amylolyticus]|uniref:DUF6789 family protein n=1 Tax=Haloarchaeobius amylolyticus TaxID=1198296 RepID=UPI00226F1E45|nr:DUF6789 family protein [Haloarchaeobius amylolyticus]